MRTGLASTKEKKLEITVCQVQGRVPVTVLQPHGDVDTSNFRQLIAKAKDVYDAGARDILLDLSDTPYLSSSGIVALHSIAVMLRGEEAPDQESGWETFRDVRRSLDLGPQQHFKLLNPRPDVDKVLDMTGFKRLMEVYTDLETAVASF